MRVVRYSGRRLTLDRFARLIISSRTKRSYTESLRLSSRHAWVNNRKITERLMSSLVTLITLPFVVPITFNKFDVPLAFNARLVISTVIASMRERSTISRSTIYGFGLKLLLQMKYISVFSIHPHACGVDCRTLLPFTVTLSFGRKKNLR